MPWYSTIFLDADGTLFDYDAAEAGALQAAFRALVGWYDTGRCLVAYRAINRELWQELERGRTTQAELAVERFRRLFVHLGIDDASPLASATSPRYLDELASRSALLGHAEAVVRRLAVGRRLALVTNGLSRVQRRRIEASPIAGCFGAVIISDEVGMAKPDPAILALACRHLGIATVGAARDGMLMVGDSLRADVACGAAFGIATCLYDPAGRPSAAAGVPESPPPTYRIRSLPELLDIAG